MRVIFAGIINTSTQERSVPSVFKEKQGIHYGRVSTGTVVIFEVREGEDEIIEGHIIYY